VVVVFTLDLLRMMICVLLFNVCVFWCIDSNVYVCVYVRVYVLISVCLHV